jgi:hypothetical protein
LFVKGGFMLRVYHIGILFFILLTTGCSTFSDFMKAAENIDNLAVKIPEYQKVYKTHYLTTPYQWKESEREEFYHIPQGTRIMPYDWFVSLEQPTSALFEQPLLTDPEYLGSMGFILDKSKKDPEKLPIGFAIDNDYVDSITDEKIPMVGLTCAACHTGELHFKKGNETHALRIDGGPGMVDPGIFADASGLAIGLTYKQDSKFNRFAKRVLDRQGKENTEQNKKALKDKVARLVKNGLTEKALQKKTMEEPPYSLKPSTFQGGFSRTDALDRILNQVFGSNLLFKNKNQIIIKDIKQEATSNYVPNNAPVNFPHIWDASWFDWVQYNASIHQPMVRNAGEALGVKASANFVDEKSLYKSSAHIKNLQKIEEWLAGKKPFGGLTSPKWPKNLFPKIDEKMAAKGKTLYKNLCQGCHLPPLEELKADLKTLKPEDRYSKDKHWTNKFWIKGYRKEGIALLEVKQIDSKYIGTDSTVLDNFNNALIRYAGALTSSGSEPNKWKPVTKNMGMGEALGNVVENVANRWYESNSIPQQERDKFNGYRENLIQAKSVYKARPLNGVWATAPFLHNGAVPTLYGMLSPVSERPKVFYLGSKMFDPKKVGFDAQEFRGGYKFDTTITGNSNKGHEFNHGPRENGKIGRYLEPSERYALIEYLKTQ